MLSLRAAAAAAAARTRAANAIPTLPTSVRRPVTTDSKPDKEKQRRTSSFTFIDNAPGWNEDVATPSEASVKADRETTTIDEMMQKTVDYVQSHHPVNDHEHEQTHAAYARDEVGGPLGNSGVGEFEGVVGNDDLGPDDDTQVDSNGRVVTRRTTGHEKTSIRKGESGTGQANV